MANPTTASTNDDAYQNAMSNYYTALANRNTQLAEQWHAEMKRLSDNKGGEFARQMSGGAK